METQAASRSHGEHRAELQTAAMPDEFQNSNINETSPDKPHNRVETTFFQIVFTQGCLQSECYGLCLSTDWMDLKGVSLQGHPQALPGLATS